MAWVSGDTRWQRHHNEHNGDGDACEAVGRVKWLQKKTNEAAAMIAGGTVDI
jgi:hypothetical protein